MDTTIIKHHKKIRNDLTGRKFGQLTCIKPTGQFIFSARQWECICDCGVKHLATANHLVAGNIISCGCSKKKLNNSHRNWKGFGEISGRYFSDLKRGAKYRNIVFDLTIEYLWNLFLTQKRCCNLTGSYLEFAQSIALKKEKQTASLDRIDPKKGYIKGNVQWVHQVVNFMKQDLNEEELINWCNRIITYKIKKV